MCGHVGVAGKLEFKDEALMKRLLVFDYFRGPDSTGLAALRNNGEVKIAKCAGSPIDLFDTGRFKEALSGHNSTVFMGHNRFMTKGKITSQNAHPWQFGDIVGCHNGTLDQASWDELVKMTGEKTEVDSMALIQAIAMFGPEKVIPKIRGAWALVWFNTKENTLNFLRNKERPFWLAYSKALDKIFWASEHPILHAATAMTTNENQSYDLHVAEETEGYRFFQTEENLWYKFNIDDIKKGGDKRPKPKVKEVKGQDPLPLTTAGTWRGGQASTANYNGGGQGANPFHQRAGSGTTTAATPSSSTTGSTTSSTTPNPPTGQSGSDFTPPAIHIMHGTVLQPFAGIISRVQFMSLAQYGCSWCRGDIDFEEIGITVLEKYKAIMCPSCGAGHDSSRVYIDPAAARLPLVNA